MGIGEFKYSAFHSSKPIIREADPEYKIRNVVMRHCGSCEMDVTTHFIPCQIIRNFCIVLDVPGAVPNTDGHAKEV